MHAQEFLHTLAHTHEYITTYKHKYYEEPNEDARTYVRSYLHQYTQKYVQYSFFGQDCTHIHDTVLRTCESVLVGLVYIICTL